MSVIRVKKDKNYFAASNVPFNDEALSWEARGVMGYLLSKPDDWQVKFTDLVKRGPAGDHKIRRILKELEEHNYLEREMYQGDDGKFNWISTVYETPTISRKSQDGSTILQLSTRGKTTRGKPRDLTSTDLTSTKRAEEEGETGGAIFLAYEQEIGNLTPMIAEELQELEREHPANWIIEAMRISATNGARTLSYFKAILERWKVEGYGSEFKPGRKGKNGKEAEPAGYAAIREFMEEQENENA